MRVADDANRIASALDAAGELRIVRQHGADADQNARAAVSGLVYMFARRFARNPAGSARAGGNLPVHGHGVFQDDIRRFRADVVKEDFIQPPAFRLQHAGHDLHARLPQDPHALARHERVGVKTPDHHAGDAAFQNGLRAGRGLSVMAAGFERDVERRAARVPAAVL